MQRGLAAPPRPRRTIEAYNIVDDDGGTYRSLFARVYRATGDSRFKVSLEVPVLADIAKDLVRHRTAEIRYPLGMLKLSNRKLRESGFVFPEGVSRALDRAIGRFHSERC
jgi:hypothetical protein